jgi:beta-N-acetylhexosaminidase
MQESDIQSHIDAMTLEQKIGQMFMANICGGESLDQARRDLEQYQFGGLQFSGVFERFVRGGDYRPCGVCRNAPLEEVAEFLSQIKQTSIDVLGIPAILGGDQEGGISGSILRRRNMSFVPVHMGLGAIGSAEAAYEAATISAREVKAMGLDMLYGPCLGVNTNPANPEIGQRSFGENPEMVATMGEQVIRAYADNGIIATAKHFPGRGHGEANAHHELESIDVDMTHMESVELLPFRRAIAANVDSIMMAHTIFPALDPSGLPASLSPTIIQGLLREKMGYKGMIIPDTLTMFAISKNYGVPEASVMCMEAGIDMIFMKVRDLYGPVIDAVVEAVRTGRLTEERLNASVERILRLKIKRGLFALKPFSAETVTQTVGCPAHVKGATKLAQDAIVAVKNSDAMLPVAAPEKQSAFVVVPRDPSIVLSNDRNLSHDMLPNALAKHFGEVEHLVVDMASTPFQSYEAVGRAKNADMVVFGIYSAGLSDEGAELLASLVELGKPVVVVITGSPYVAAKLPEAVRGILCSFGMTPFAFNAVADVVAGKHIPTGKLPVTLSDVWPRGYSAVVGSAG